MLQIGLSSCGKTLDDALFAAYQASGIERIELSGKREDFDGMDFSELARLSRTYGVKLHSLHLPFQSSKDGWIDVSDPQAADGVVEYFETLIRKGSAVGISCYVVHPSGEPIAPADRDVRMSCAKAHLASLAEIANRHGAVIAVENLPRTCLGRNSDEMLELLSAHKDLRICFDTNHLLGEDPLVHLDRVGEKLVTTHVSDYDFVNERHWLPGEGLLDWQAILGKLGEIGYDGVWLYEIIFTCPKTILRDRDLTCADFARNAAELFAGKVPTVVSRPKPNLGMWG